MKLTKQQIQEKLELVKNKPELLQISNHETLGNYIVVVPALIHESGITSRSTQYEDRPEIGLVVSVGDQINKVSVGSLIFFGKYSTEQLTYDGITYIILREEDVYSVTEQI